jgi:hypothetical protein
MAAKFVIEDQTHAEWISEHASFAEAWEELRRLAALPWDQSPNVAPCASWRTCERTYELIEYDTFAEPWRLVRRLPAFEISARGVKWSPEANSRADR